MIEIILKPKHFKKAKSYVINCPLTIAINDNYNININNIIVGANYTYFNKKHYTIKTSLTVKDFNKYIKNAKNKKKVGTHYIYLIEL